MIDNTTRIFDNMQQLIGKTPIVKLTRLCARENITANIMGKLESFNPLGSIKDRTAYYMLKTAIEQGKLQKDTVIIEPTSGNTGIGLAYIAAILGNKLILTMPESMSVERRKLLSALGAEVVLTPAAEGMSGAVAHAKELADSYDSVFLPMQFANPSNPMAHYCTTAPEIHEATGGKIDYIVATAGTGGTISGIGRYFKEKCPTTKIICVEPASSPLLTKGYAAPHGIQGIGANFVPDCLDTSVIDEVIDITDDEAMRITALLPKTDGVFVGISSGAAVAGAMQIAARPENANATILAILPDGGDRYLSCDFWDKY